MRTTSASWMLAQETRALLTRLDRLVPFALRMPMVTAAAVSPAAQTAIERHMTQARRTLRGLARAYLRWLAGPEGRAVKPFQMQRRFTFLRMRFNSVIAQFDIFADVLTQRSEHETGVWVSGLDVVAADALELPGAYFKTPPVICYVDRGHGAAIRRARTRLPGGEENPVAIIRVPRERMVGSGIASSLIHEVGHQGAALLDLVNSLRPELNELQARTAGEEQRAWQLWERWISEIVADFWSVGRVGVTSTVGLMGVVSLPRAFVFRVDLEDPHPIPWIRVKLSCAIGRALYPHPQWDALAQLWEEYYPRDGLDEERQKLLTALEATMPRFVEILAGHRPLALDGSSLREVLGAQEIRPAQLAARFREWGGDLGQMRDARPTLAFAVIGQARATGEMTPEDESRTLAGLLAHWALQNTLRASAPCGTARALRPEAAKGEGAALAG